MEFSIKSILLAGIGTIAYTYEKASSMVDELVKKGELTISQGRELNEELKKKLKPDAAKESAEDNLIADKLKGVLAELNLATKADLEDLKQRIANLENRGNQ